MVRQGKWAIVGGWYLQPDCNIPDGESFLRHSLISQRYFREKFGITAKTGYNVDSFGHNASLPKLLRAAGMENYVFMRPSPQEQGRSEQLFHWESDDGSSVLAYRIPHYYNITVARLPYAEQAAQKADATGDDVMIFCGIGNHGGGPTIELLKELEKMPMEGKIYSCPDAFFQANSKKELPVLTGELQHHARGCYSAESSVKTLNRKAEQSLLAAEVFSVMAKQLVDAAYPAEELRSGWENLLFNQFHDILCGCSIKSVYEDARYQLGHTISLAEQVINRALQRISWKIDTLQGSKLPSYKTQENFAIWQHEALGTPVILFNAHPWPVKQTVVFSAKQARVVDALGTELPTQKVRSYTTDPGVYHYTIFEAEVPAMGYTVYRAFNGQTGTAVVENPVTVTETTLENAFIRVELDKQTGDLRRIYHKKTGRYILDHTCKAILTDETACDTWAHDQFDLGPTVGSFCACNFEIMEHGSIRGAVRTTSCCGNSRLVRTYTITAGSDEVQVHTTVDFHEKHKALKFTFPLAEETVTAKIPCGTIRRVGYTGEEPFGSWLASGSLGVANDCKYGYDTRDGEVCMTVLRGAIYANHFGERDAFCEYMDQGIHEFNYSVFPYSGVSDSEHRAAQLNFPLRQITGGFHDGPLPQTMACLENPQENVRIAALKEQEDGNGMVLRLCEMEGEDTQVSLKLFGKTIDAYLPHNGVKTIHDSGRELDAMEWEQ